MEFNPINCEVLSVTRKRIDSYSLHNATLRRVSSTKYLGITISSDLIWNNLAYKALVRPRLEYCARV